MKIWHAPFVIARHYAHHIHASINVLHRALPSRNGMAFCFARQFELFSIVSDEFMTDNHDGPQRRAAVAT